jgi:transposase
MNTHAFHHVAIDVSKDKHNFAYLNSTQSRQRGEFKNQEDAIQSWINALPFERESLFVTFEATGTYSDRLLHTLSKNEITFAVVNPATSASMAKALNKSTKNDSQDALLLLDIAKRLDLKKYNMPSAEQKRRKELLSARDSLQKVENQLLNQIHAFSYRVEPNQVATSVLEESLKTIQEQLKKLDDEFGQNIPDDKETEVIVKRISSIKSVGPVTANVIAISFGDMSQFETHKQFVKHIGLAPDEHTSGTSVKRKSRINRKGDPKIRSLLFNCARSAIQHNPECKELFQRLKARGKNGNQAITAVMHKLARLIYGVVRSGRDYDPNYIELKK